jgi:hypothetical protein
MTPQSRGFAASGHGAVDCRPRCMWIFGIAVGTLGTFNLSLLLALVGLRSASGC